MNFYDAFKNHVENHMSKEKSKKIYILPKRKCTFHPKLDSNINKKKLNQIITIDQHTPSLQRERVLQGSMKKYLSQDKRPFCLTYDQEEKVNNTVSKRKQIRQKISTHFHPSIFKARQCRVNEKVQNSSKKVKQDLSQTQIKIQQRKNKSPDENKSIQDIQMQNSGKKNSLPHLTKKSISFSQYGGNAPIRPKNSRSKLGQYSPVREDIYFQKTGIINGYSLSNKERPRATTQRAFEFEDLPCLSNSQSQSHNLADRYYSLIRKTDYRKMTNYAGKKIINNNFLQLKKKKSAENDSLQITQIHGKSLIKIQKILSLKNKQQSL